MNDESNGARRGPQVWVVTGFLLAFGATILTVVLTGLFVRAPGSGARDANPASVGMERAEPVGNDDGMPAVGDRMPAVGSDGRAPAAASGRATPSQ